MSRTIIVSNRLPLKAKVVNGRIEITSSEGGLATGLKSVHQQSDSSWIGWPGVATENMEEHLREELTQRMREEKCDPVYLTSNEVEDFYVGFSNQVIWPLFHYFTEYTRFNEKKWEAYKRVNRKFADKVLEQAHIDDIVWVHDYHLMLVPGYLRRVYPELKIGFFLHIPFPAFEVYKMLPVRLEVMDGLLGADLIGFHTYGYQRHFLDSARNINGYEVIRNNIFNGKSTSKVEVFPMGIDVEKFERTAKKHQRTEKDNVSELQEEIVREKKRHPGMKFVLSMDRLDYTKGIANRLKAFDYFLKKNPHYKKKVTLIMLSVPSRTNVPQYQQLKKEIDELVGRINGRYGTACWNPIWYFYRSLPFDNLIDLYTNCEIALLTPLRDGMNLIAKEYIISRTDQTGVLILSELAGAAEEMNEALLINPNSFKEINQALVRALNMPLSDQKEMNQCIQARLRKNDINHWSSNFLYQLKNIKNSNSEFSPTKLERGAHNKLLHNYKKANSRLFFLDYDGTLVDFVNNPENATPDEKLIYLIKKLAAVKENQIVIVSGRDEKTLHKWWGRLPVSIIAEHGNSMHSAAGPHFLSKEEMNPSWKNLVNPILSTFTERTPGSFIEKKRNGLAWHYRQAEEHIGEQKANQLSVLLQELLIGRDLTVYHGLKVVEVVSTRSNKGTAVSQWMSQHPADFVLAIGDDYTDEFMFSALPSSAHTIKVGKSYTRAQYYIENLESVRELLECFTIPDKEEALYPALLTKSSGQKVS